MEHMFIYISSVVSYETFGSESAMTNLKAIVVSCSVSMRGHAFVEFDSADVAARAVDDALADAEADLETDDDADIDGGVVVTDGVADGVFVREGVGVRDVLILGGQPGQIRLPGPSAVCSIWCAASRSGAASACV
jgi:hypothetical protein